MEEMITRNTKIFHAGSYFIGHYNMLDIQLIGDDFRISIPANRIGELTRKIFPEIDWENGEFLHEMKGKYVRIVTDKNYHIVALQHIIKDSQIYWLENE